MVGQRMAVAGRYALISPLGRGGMGQVWEGRDERLGRPVALKLLTADALAGRAQPDDLIRRFIREAAVTAGLEHPGVPAVYDAGQHDGGLFLVMELVEGCTISDLIAEHGPLPISWVAGAGAQVAAVLAVAHERGIIHRDIKPQNIMLTREGTAKVLDFGVASVVSQRITSTGVAVGTPAYMAPEQLQSLPATPRTDLYALGCLLYEMLAGGPVFTAPSPAGLMRMHLEQLPARPDRDDLDPGLGTLVRQLLEKDPARRPADAREVYHRLLPYLQPPGPLGDIAPGGSSGQHLYSLATVLLGGGARPQPGTPPPTQPPRPWTDPQPETAPAPGWQLRHSLWVLPALLFGLATWLSFGYIGIRHRRWPWLAAGAGYLALMIAAITLVGSGPDVAGNGPLPGTTITGLVIWLAVWPAGFVHALWVNSSARLPLLASGGKGP